MLVGLSAGLFSCEKDGKYKDYVYPEPVVSEIYPESGYVASLVAIIGTDFGDRVEPVKIFFGGVEAENIVSCSNNRIIVEIPEGAQSGDISLQVWTHTLESAGKFTVIPTPVINSIVSNNANGESFAQGGDEVTILGSAFGTVASDVAVTINDKKAEITSVTDNEIKVVVPADYGSGLVAVNVKGYVVEGTALIDPSVSGDVTRLFLKNYSQPFQRGDSGDGEWGTALYWSKNSNFNGSSLQFPDEQPDGLLTMVGSNNKWNGALYQITSLPAGTYEFEVEVAGTQSVGGRYGTQFAVVKGEGIFPGLADNIDGKKVPWTFSDMSTVLCNVNLAVGNGNEASGTFTCEVALEGTTQVTIGFATMLGNNNYVKVSGIKIIRK